MLNAPYQSTIVARVEALGRSIQSILLNAILHYRQEEPCFASCVLLEYVRNQIIGFQRNKKFIKTNDRIGENLSSRFLLQREYYIHNYKYLKMLFTLCVILFIHILSITTSNN